MYNTLKNIALFLLGLTSPIWVHIAQIIIGLTITPRNGGAVMSGVIASFPYNIMAFLVFMGALAYL